MRKWGLLILAALVLFSSPVRGQDRFTGMACSEDECGKEPTYYTVGNATMQVFDDTHGMLTARDYYGNFVISYYGDGTVNVDGLELRSNGDVYDNGNYVTRVDGSAAAFSAVNDALVQNHPKVTSGIIQDLVWAAKAGVGKSCKDASFNSLIASYVLLGTVVITFLPGPMTPTNSVALMAAFGAWRKVWSDQEQVCGARPY